MQLFLHDKSLAVILCDLQLCSKALEYIICC